MIRYSIFMFGIIGMAATAIAHVMPIPASGESHGSSVAFRTVAAIPSHHLVLEKCALEDCSDTPQ